ncbi:hypothetical protein JTB14_021780 [Gonioctena quinquepunctata]|nr:hypothetical protein JTB14_021780 [Gonioctena quinquepunctata]
MYENCQYPLIVSYETEYQNTKEEGKESGRKDSSKDQDDNDELENPSCSSETEKKNELDKNKNYCNSNDNFCQRRSSRIPKYLLSIQISWQENYLALSQEQYIYKLLEKYNFLNCKPTSTPMDCGTRLEKAKPGITTHKRKKGQDSSSWSDDNDKHDTIGVPQSSKAAPDDSSPLTSERACAVNPKITKNDVWHENVELASQLTVEKKKDLSQNSLVSPRNYDLKLMQENAIMLVLANETGDIAGKEQLLMGLWFHNESKRKIREEFVGFVKLSAQDTSSIAEAINNFLVSYNLPPEFARDVVSMAALQWQENMADHKLNLVVNDAHKVPEIRNTIATIEDTINFFRESTVRRNCAPNLSRMCETRWSEKYTSIRKFSQNFPELVKALEKLCTEGNYAYQLHSVVTKPLFIIAFITIAKYSLVLEPVVNAWQAKTVDLIGVGEHISGILDVLKQNRKDADRMTNELLKKAQYIATELEIRKHLFLVLLESKNTGAILHQTMIMNTGDVH